MNRLAVTCIFLFSLCAMFSGPIKAANSVAPTGAEKYIGAFSNVTVSKNSGDCAGFSLRLWRAAGLTATSPRLVGVFYDTSGSCPGVAYALQDVRYEESSGRLDFNASSTSGDEMAFRFTGRMRPTAVTGKLFYLNSKASAPQDMGNVDLRKVSDERSVH